MTTESKNAVAAHLCGNINKAELYRRIRDKNPQDLEQVKREVEEYEVA